jgi:AraC-like DNA-binding protein
MAHGTWKKTSTSSPYFDPHTGSGVLLDDEEVPSLRVHECGAKVIDRHWSHQGVRSPFWRAYFNPNEGAAVRVAGKWISLGPSRVVIIPEDTLFDCRCRGSVRHLWIHFSYPLAGDPPSAWTGKLQEPERDIWHSLYDLANRKSSPHRLRYACAAALMQEFGKKEEATPPVRSEQLRRIHAWMKNCMRMPPSLDEMAAHAGMSRRSFLRWFLAETGETPVAFQRRIRIREACRLLRFGNQSVDEIAEATGFADRHHFTRAFKAITGMGPAAFRRASPAR